MDLGVLEGQTKGGYFSDSIFDPSVNQCIVQLQYNSFNPEFLLFITHSLTTANRAYWADIL